MRTRSLTGPCDLIVPTAGRPHRPSVSLNATVPPRGVLPSSETAESSWKHATSVPVSSSLTARKYRSMTPGAAGLMVGPPWDSTREQRGDCTPNRICNLPHASEQLLNELGRPGRRIGGPQSGAVPSARRAHLLVGEDASDGCGQRLGRCLGLAARPPQLRGRPPGLQLRADPAP